MICMLIFQFKSPSRHSMNTSFQTWSKILIMIWVRVSMINTIVLPPCLVLTKTDYQNAVYDFKMNQRNKRFNFLQSVKFFQENWTYAKQVEFNNILHENASSYNQIIYDIDDPADKIFLIRSGKAIVETLIQINEENTYPIVREN